MTSRLTRLLLAACAILAVAAPSAALANGKKHHRFGKAVKVACKYIERGKTVRSFTAEQNQALVDACAARKAAIKAANDAFVAETQDDIDAYRAVRKAVATDLRAAHDAKRSACAEDRSPQQCLDAKAAYGTTVAGLRTQLRDAYKAYIAAVKPALVTRNTAVREAEKAFRAAVEQIRSQA